MRVNFLAAPAVGTNWAIRIKGNAKSTLDGMVGAGRLTSTGSYTGKKAGVLYDAAGGYTYYAMADSNAFVSAPIASAYHSVTFEKAPSQDVRVHVSEVNNGSYDPDLRPFTLTMSSGGAYASNLTFNAVGDYPFTLKITAGGKSATDTGTIHVVSLNPGSLASLTWKGGASTVLMDRREWWWSGNWQEGVPPTNPTTARILFKAPGQSVRGIIEQPRTIGGIRIGQSDSTPMNHTLDLGGTVLTLAGDLDNTILINSVFSLTNGTLRIGSDTVDGNILIGADTTGYGSAALQCRAGTIIETRRVGTLRAGTADGGSNSLSIGESGYGGTAYIGNPVDAAYRLPANVSIRVGSGSSARGSIQIGKNTSAGQAFSATLTASSGGMFTAWLTDLKIVPYEAAYSGNAQQNGTLDLGRMTNCSVDVRNVYVAPNYSLNASAQPRGTLRLPPGTVKAGTVEVGAATGAGFGLLVTSNTVVTITNSLAVRATGDVTNFVGAVPGGFDIARSAAGALTVESGATLTIRFMQPVATRPHYGLRWAGNQVATLTGLQSLGKLVIDDSRLGKRASIYFQSGYTYVGLPAGGGTMFSLR